MFKSNKLKFIIVFVSMILLAVLIFNFATAAFNLPTDIESIQKSYIPIGAGVKDVETIVGLVVKILQWTYTIFFIIAVLFIIFAAYNYLTAQADAEKIKNSHQQLIWAAVAIAVALISISANVIIKNFIGSESGGSSSLGTGQYQQNNNIYPSNVNVDSEAYNERIQRDLEYMTK